MSNNYINLLRKLYKVNLFHPTKVGLNSINSIYKLLGKPLDHIPVVRIYIITIINDNYFYI